LEALMAPPQTLIRPWMSVPSIAKKRLVALSMSEW